jgi:hypothetical protein
MNIFKRSQILSNEVIRQPSVQESRNESHLELSDFQNGKFAECIADARKSVKGQSYARTHAGLIRTHIKWSQLRFCFSWLTVRA